MDHYTLDDNSILEPPDDEGVIRRIDVHGNSEIFLRPGDNDWQKWADVFARVIELPVFNTKVTLVGDYPAGGKIESEIGHDVIESFILACACAGVDIDSPAFLEAVETTIDAVSNQE